jgi:gliding motility-associated protein GldE
LLKPFLLQVNLQGTTLLVVAIIVALIISYFISGAEVAFFSLTYKDMNLLKTKQGPGWKRILNLLEEPKTLLGSLRIANVFVNIIIIILSNFLIDQLLPIENSWWVFNFLVKIILVTTFLVLFAEVLPKVYATQNNLRFARDASYLVEIIHLLFRRISLWMLSITDSAEKIAGNRDASYSLEELDHAIDLTTKNDASEDEKNILKGIVKFGNITVKQVMRTRLDVSGIDHNLNFKQLIDRLEELHYSRLPVYKRSLDDVVGIIHTKDILQVIDEGDNFDWHYLLRQPYFIHEQKMIEDLLHEFQAKRIHFAVVVDEFGGTSGIVTLEDIMEEIIGDIKDEFDDDDIVNRKLDDFTYILKGAPMINDACKIMHIPLDTFDEIREDADSLAGLILEVAGQIPRVDDILNIGDFEFTIVEVEKNRIQKVKVTIKTQTES